MDLRENVTFAPFIETYEQRVAQYTALTARLASANGNREAAVSEFLTGSDDEQAVRIRTKIAEMRDQVAQLETRFQKYAEDHVVVETLPQEELDKLTAEAAEAKKAVKVSVTSFGYVLDTLQLSQPGIENDVKEYLAAHPDPTTKRTVSSGDSLPRYPCTVDVVVSTAPDKIVHFDNLSTTAPFVGLNSRTLGEKLAEAAQVQYPLLSAIKGVVSFDIISENATYSLTVTPKATKKPGRVPGATRSPAPAAAPVEASTDASEQPQQPQQDDDAGVTE